MDDLRNWRNQEMISWRNQEIREIDEDIEMISTSMATLSTMVAEQGEKINVCETQVSESSVHVQEAVDHVERASDWQERARSVLFDAAVVIGGTGLGCAGFLGGPLVGTVSFVTCVGAGVALVAARKHIVGSPQ